MPIYEYKCLECGAHVEKMQKVSDEPLKICEKCGGKLEKQWSLSGFQFKGAGWYVTDYTGKKSDKNAESAGKTEAENVAKSEKAEKSSSSESTAKTESASKQKKDDSSNSKKDSVSNK